ncbi:UNVERIFIED_CONTAM: hypothetical protein ITH83_25680, partial [Salmonella enterica subsp. enterica serovar Weltevreden]
FCLAKNLYGDRMLTPDDRTLNDLTDNHLLYHRNDLCTIRVGDRSLRFGDRSSKLLI